MGAAMTNSSDYAHATPEEIEIIRDLEARTDAATSPLDQVVQLAQIYIEPAHRTERAVSLLETVLSRDPEHPAASYWWADCAIRFLMDEDSLQRATRLLEYALRSETPYAGAGYMLLAEALHDLETLSLPREIELYEESVLREPGWVNNRRYLALAYERPVGCQRQPISYDSHWRT